MARPEDQDITGEQQRRGKKQDFLPYQLWHYHLSTYLAEQVCRIKQKCATLDLPILANPVVGLESEAVGALPPDESMSLRPDDAIAKTVACRAVLLSVVLKVVPEVVCEDIFSRRSTFQN